MSTSVCAVQAVAAAKSSNGSNALFVLLRVCERCECSESSAQEILHCSAQSTSKQGAWALPASRHSAEATAARIVGGRRQGSSASRIALHWCLLASNLARVWHLQRPDTSCCSNSANLFYSLWLCLVSDTGLSRLAHCVQPDSSSLLADSSACVSGPSACAFAHRRSKQHAAPLLEVQGSAARLATVWGADLQARVRLQQACLGAAKRAQAQVELRGRVRSVNWSIRVPCAQTHGLRRHQRQRRIHAQCEADAQGKDDGAEASPAR